MTLQTFVALAEIVSSIAVTATLVVLVVSIRQSTKASRILVVESLSAAIAAINVPARGKCLIRPARNARNITA